MNRPFKASASAVEQPAGSGHSSDELPQVVTPWMTSPQCAAYMGFPTLRAFYVFLYTATGKQLPRGRCGRALRFERDVVDAFMRGDLRKGRTTQAVARRFSVIHTPKSVGLSPASEGGKTGR